MDKLGAIFLVTLVIIIVYPNFTFLKELKKIEKNHFKYKLIYFLMCLIFPCSVIFIVAAILSSPAFIDLLNLDIDTSTYTYRIFIGIIIFPLSIIINIYFTKFYLKRISKTKNEIELIGKE